METKSKLEKGMVAIFEIKLNVNKDSKLEAEVSTGDFLSESEDETMRIPTEQAIDFAALRDVTNMLVRKMKGYIYAQHIVLGPGHYQLTLRKV